MEPETKPCAVCGATLVRSRRRSAAEWAKREVCAGKCHNELMHRRQLARPTKKCPGCKLVLPRDSFGWRQGEDSKLQSLCFLCTRKEARELQKRRPPRRFKAGRTTPEKKRARELLQAAVRRGDVARPDTCEKCGQRPALMRDGRSRIQAHHHNGYDKPLDVTWLCTDCHGEEHRLPDDKRRIRSLLDDASESLAKTNESQISNSTAAVCPKCGPGCYR